jgi:hypothetical protein
LLTRWRSHTVREPLRGACRAAQAPALPRLVGILSIGDLAHSEDAVGTGKTVAEISQPGGAHSQTSH